MRTLVYKRTHKGDPDANGCFGVEDCMGNIRAWNFDAVIGIGGIGGEPKTQNINGLVNWIGIGPRKVQSVGMRGPLVTFDHFYFREEGGKEFKGIARNLARRLYSANAPRFVLDSVTDAERKEIDEVLSLAKDAGPSKPLAPFPSKNKRVCPVVRCPTKSKRNHRRCPSAPLLALRRKDTNSRV